MNNLGWFLVYVALFVAIPLLPIWSINTLFNLGIAYSITNWLAVLALAFWIKYLQIDPNKK